MTPSGITVSSKRAPRQVARWIPFFAAFVFLLPGQLRSAATPGPLHPQAADPANETDLTGAIEATRRTHDESQLNSLQAQLQHRLTANPKDATLQYQSALVQSYLVDVYVSRKETKKANQMLDSAIAAAQRSIQLNDMSADAHSLLADLYGRKISLGNGMFAGPKFGPKVKQENQRATELGDKNPRVWASLGRQYLMAPKMFGGDTAKAIECFQKSLELNAQQDDTYVWLAKAYQKEGDKTHAQEALQHALELNPQNKFATETQNALSK